MSNAIHDDFAPVEGRQVTLRAMVESLTKAGAARPCQ
jgi:hypothetical protein